MTRTVRRPESASSSTATPSFAWANKWNDQLIVRGEPTRSARLAVSGPHDRAGDRHGARHGPSGHSPRSCDRGRTVYWVAPVIKRQADLDRLLSHPLGVPVTDGMASHPVKHRDLGAMPAWRRDSATRSPRRRNGRSCRPPSRHTSFPEVASNLIQRRKQIFDQIVGVFEAG